MNLTYHKIQNLLKAHQALDGAETVVQIDSVQRRIVRVPYDFAPKVRITLARNMAELQSAHDAIDKALDSVLIRHSGGSDTLKRDDNPAVFNAYMKEREALLSEEVDVSIATIAEGDLKPDANKLQPSVIAALLPILKPVP